MLQWQLRCRWLSETVGLLPLTLRLPLHTCPPSCSPRTPGFLSSDALCSPLSWGLTAGPPALWDSLPSSWNPCSSFIAPGRCPCLPPATYNTGAGCHLHCSPRLVVLLMLCEAHSERCLFLPTGLSSKRVGAGPSFAHSCFLAQHHARHTTRCSVCITLGERRKEGMNERVFLPSLCL